MSADDEEKKCFLKGPIPKQKSFIQRFICKRERISLILSARSEPFTRDTSQSDFNQGLSAANPKRIPQIIKKLETMISSLTLPRSARKNEPMTRTHGNKKCQGHLLQTIHYRLFFHCNRIWCIVYKWIHLRVLLGDQIDTHIYKALLDWRLADMECKQPLPCRRVIERLYS